MVRYSGIVDIEAEEKSMRKKMRKAFDLLKANLLGLRDDVDDVKSDYKAKHEKLQELEDALRPLEDAYSLTEKGFQEPKFQLEDHAEYVFAIKSVKEEQKEAVRSKNAVVGHTDWTVGDSKSEGRKMVGRAVRLTLRAFNNECDSRIGKINWRNINQVKDRIEASRDSLDKLNESLHVEITDEYLQLKFKEADLVNEEKIKKEQEKDQLRAVREAEREEAKAQREILAEIKRSEKLEAAKQAALDEVKARLKIASQEHRAALEAEVNELESELAAASMSKGRLLSMAEHTKIGHLYVISNRGAFGERMIKIGMTRRLEPLDRVKELGDASVPFPFDIHAMVFSEDVPRLEKELHARFDDFRVNRLNRRKEFFNVPLSDVQKELETRIPGTPFQFNAPSMEYEGSIISEANKVGETNSIAGQFSSEI
ncbi:MAG: DUF4041 domain-containing protein [Phycisphaeraceae bacterium]|nr:DUF4041 domain-containing protein [Phycisphaeraceae bacterium]